LQVKYHLKTDTPMFVVRLYSIALFITLLTAAFKSFGHAPGFDASLVFFQPSPTDTTGLRQLIDSTERLVDERMFAEAQLLLDQILAISERELGRVSIETADILHQLARIQNFKYNSKAAIQLNEEALTIRQELFGARSPEAALSYESLGINYYFAGQYFEALPFFKTQYDIWQSLPELDKNEIATACNLLGLTYDAIGDFETSLDYKRQTLQMRREVLGEEHELTGVAYNNLGINYDHMGDHDQAIAYKLKALAIIEKAVGINDEFYATSAANVGVSYYEKGDYDNAIRWIGIGLDLHKSLLGESDYNTIGSYNNLAGCYDGKKDFPTAIALKKNALDRTQALYKKSHAQTANILNNIGFSFLMSHQPDSALFYISKSIKMYEEVFDVERPDMIQPYRNMAMSYLQKNDFEQALYHIHKAIAIAETIQYGNRTYLALVHENLGDILRLRYEAEGNTAWLESAGKQYDTAFKLYREQLLQVSSGAKKDLAENISLLGDKLIPVKLKLSDQLQDVDQKRGIFAFVEQSKAMLLYQSIRENQVLNFAGVDAALREKDREMKLKIAYYENKMRELQFRQVAEDNPQALAVSAALFDLNGEHSALKQQIRASNPTYHDMVFDLKAVTLEDVQSQLSDNEEGMLEYFVGDSSIFLLLVTSNDYQVVEVKADAPIALLVQQLRTGLYGYHTTLNKLDTLLPYTTSLYIDAARKLYDLLIAPVQSPLPKRLIIVPDGVLGYVPFEALLTEAPGNPYQFQNHSYFGKNHIISYSYSATLLREMREKQHLHTPKGSVLAMAPFFHGDAKKTAQSINPADPLFKSVSRGNALGTLHFSGEEVLRIARAYKGKALLGADATKTTFIEQATDYRYLHLSTHGVADDRVGDYAYLTFAHPDNQTQFEKLYVRDIYNLSLNADLVVLSACQTGIGKLQRGEGFISLSRAFAYAGAKSIVTTLWSVNDEKTKDFMLGFYRHLKEKPAAEALWEARREFLSKHKGEAAHPYYWAAFIGIGDMR